MTQVDDHVLANWTGSRIDTVLVDGERWAVKSRGRREALGYHLARGLLNVPEVQLLQQPAGRPRALVRLAENYTRRDLPIQDLDEAAAGELAFSLWIRRRDTHAYNRAYVEGIPMFFDHGAAFTVSAGLDRFLRPGADNGFVPAWRVEEWDHTPTTIGTRWLDDATGLAVHPIRDRTRFFDRFHAWVDELAGYPMMGIERALRSAGVRGKRFDELRQFLQRTRSELPEAARQLGELLESPTRARVRRQPVAPV